MSDLLLLIVLAIFGFLLEKLLNKLLGVEKRKISETPGKKVDQWGKGIIAVIFLCCFLFVVQNKMTLNLKWYWIVYFTINFGFQSFLEWKYLKNSNQYIVTLIFLMLVVILFFNIEYLLGLLN